MKEKKVKVEPLSVVRLLLGESAPHLQGSYNPGTEQVLNAPGILDHLWDGVPLSTLWGNACPSELLLVAHAAQRAATAVGTLRGGGQGSGSG